MKKYELTDETIKAGDLGGFIDKEGNLSHYGNARVFGDAWVSENAQISTCNIVFTYDYIS